MKHTEIELKVKIQNSLELKKFLEKNGTLVLEEHQIDEYFIPSHRDFTAVRPKPVSEWLRLRSENGKYYINYKNWHYKANGVADFCDEFESKIDDIEALQKIFKVLNFKPITTVDKKRKSWLYKNYEVSMDSVEKLGDFVEIEYKGKEAKVNPETIVKEMLEFLRKMKVGKIERDFVGYPYLLLFGKT